MTDGAPPAGITLAALIVTCNRLPMLRRTLPRVLTEAPDRVVVVDNASTDGTGDWLAAQDDPRLTVLSLAENGGGAGGFAAGLDAVMNAPPGTAGAPDWCVLFDDDAAPCPGAFARFRAIAAGLNPDAAPETDPVTAQPVGVVAAAVVHPDGALSEMNRPGRNPFWHLPLLVRSLAGALRGSGRGAFHVADADLTPEAAPRRIDVASFVGFFVSRGTVAHVGLPEAGLFLYGDDVLYALRVRRAGIGIELHPAVRFEHDCATMNAGYVYRPLWKIYYHCRNGVQIAREAAGPVIFPAALAYYTTLWWWRGRGCPPDDRAVYYRMMRAGLRDGLRGRRGRNDAVHAMAQTATVRTATVAPPPPGG